MFIYIHAHVTLYTVLVINRVMVYNLSKYSMLDEKLIINSITKEEKMILKTIDPSTISKEDFYPTEAPNVFVKADGTTVILSEEQAYMIKEKE